MGVFYWKDGILGNQTGKFGVFALGGLGEIGMNCLAVESSGRLLLVDCGAMFSSDGVGVDLIHPGFDTLAERRDDIEGVVLTHAHEDHIAGVPFLLRELDVPVYASRYALGMLGDKMVEFDLVPKLLSHTLNPGETADIGPFHLSSFPMPHSRAENMGFVIDMPGGRILHTGDFKLNLEGEAGGEDVLERLRNAAGGRVDLMLADSTGSEEDEIAGEEAEVTEALDRLVRAATRRVFVAIFSSNVTRLKSVLEVARRHERCVALCGRSVNTHTRVASEVGILEFPKGVVVPLEKAAELPARKSLVVVSGTQGEPRSALGRLADGNHHVLKIAKDDLVIMSSRFIPGNELAIGRVIDNLFRSGAKVVHRGIEKDVHVSGHGSRQEISKAIDAVSPRCFMPMHGTYRHLVACAELARNAGVKNVCVATDGQMVYCDDAGLRVQEGKNPPKKIFIDGKSGLTEGAIRDRRLLGSHGVLVVAFSFSGTGDIEGNIDVVARGVTHDEALPWLADQVRDKVKDIIGSMNPDDAINADRCRDLVRSGVRRFVSKLISREPYVLVSVLR